MNRSAAYEAVRAFKSSKAGSVTCKILDELGLAQPQEEERLLLPGKVWALVLTALIRADPQHLSTSSAQNLVHALVGHWAVVKDRGAAAQVLLAQRAFCVGARRGQRQWSLVTQAGEVFKADGEIIVPRGYKAVGGEPPASAIPYSLSIQVMPPDGDPPTLSSVSSLRDPARVETAKEIAQAEKEALAARSLAQDLDMSISLAEAELRVLVEASANQRAAVSAVDQALALATDELNYLLQRANMTITNGGRAQEDGAAATAGRGLVVLQNQVKQIRDKLPNQRDPLGTLRRALVI